MAKLKISPLDDRVVVEQKEADERTTGGIYLPEQAKERPTRGTVMAVGPGKVLESGNRAPMTVKFGNEVFYAKYSGTEIELDGKKYTVLHESDVLAIIE